MGSIVILVLPVGDACHGCMGASAVREHWDNGRVVVLTASEFFGGLPFSGVSLMWKHAAQEMEQHVNELETKPVLDESRFKEDATATFRGDDLPVVQLLLSQQSPIMEHLCIGRLPF